MLESYLGQVAAALPGRTKARAAILAELRAGLLDAADAYHRRGLAASSAMEAAAEEFGDPATVAAALRPELAATQARHAGITLLASVPLVVVVWTGAAFASHIGAHQAPPWQWAGAPSSWHIVLPLAEWRSLSGYGWQWLPSPRQDSSPAGYRTALASLLQRQPWPGSRALPSM